MKYNEDQIASKFLEEIYKNLFQNVIEYLNIDKTYQFEVSEVMPNMFPSDVHEFIESLGWTYFESDSNGWEQDTWYYYRHEDYSFVLVMSYSGFYGGIVLYCSD